MRSKARNIGYILDSKDLSKNSRHKKLYGPNELMEQPNTYDGFLLACLFDVKLCVFTLKFGRTAMESA